MAHKRATGVDRPVKPVPVPVGNQTRPRVDGYGFGRVRGRVASEAPAGTPWRTLIVRQRPATLFCLSTLVMNFIDDVFDLLSVGDDRLPVQLQRVDFLCDDERCFLPERNKRTS